MEEEEVKGRYELRREDASVRDRFEVVEDGKKAKMRRRRMQMTRT